MTDILNRTSGFILTGTALLLILAMPAYADSLMFILPVLSVFGPIVAIIVIIVEAVIIGLIAEPGWLSALGASFYANVFSVMVGVIIVVLSGAYVNILMLWLVINPVALLALYLYYRVSRALVLPLIGAGCIIVGMPGQYLLYNHSGIMGGDIHLSSRLSLILPFHLGITLAVEVWPARIYLPHNMVSKAMLWANIASYFLIIIPIIWTLHLWI
jgi:hypothetical protein